MGCFAYFSGIAFGQTSTNKNKNKPPQTTFSRKTIEGKEYYFIVSKRMTYSTASD